MNKPKSNVDKFYHRNTICLTQLFLYLQSRKKNSMLSRRKFLDLGLKTVVVIGAGNLLQSFNTPDFSMPAKKKVLLRFGLASDGHFGQSGTPFEANHREMIGWLNGEVPKRGLHFSVINGDLYHDNIDFLPQVKQTWDGLKMPYYVTHGNHDHASAETWEKTWKIPLHHAFEEKDCAFLILNTADENGKYICPDLNWTREKLRLYQTKKHLFVFMHITPIKWTDNGIDCPELVEMFSKQANLRGVFHGHDHDQDGVKERNGKHYFFDSHIGGNWGTPYRGYRIVEVLKNGTVLTYQVNPNIADPVNQHNLAP